MSPLPFEGSRRQDLLDAALRRLQAISFGDPHWESQTLLARCLGLTRMDLIRDPMAEVEASLQRKFADWLDRYSAGEPLAYLEGSVGFFGREFQVDARVLVPRADSECVVEACLDLMKDRPHGTILDVGIGSGCLLMTLLCEQPQWRGIGIDFCEQALAVAAANRAALKLENRCALIRGSWMHGMAPRGSLDLVVSNPPYVVEGEALGPGVQEFEPHLALFTPDSDAMSPYRTLVQQARSCLASDGALVFEVGADRDRQVAAIGLDAGFCFLETREDLGGVARAVVLQQPAA